MEFASLDRPKPLVISDRADELANAIAQAVEPADACPHVAIAHNGPGSCRVFLPEPTQGSIELPRAVMTPRGIANELVEFMDTEARYPEKPAINNPRKAWAIRKIEIDGRGAAVATATWI